MSNHVNFEEFAAYIESDERRECGDPGDHGLTSDDFVQIHPIKLGFSHEECNEWHLKQASYFDGRLAAVWVYGPYKYQSRAKTRQANECPDFLRPLGLRRISEL